ncbi:hypothetical protein [Deinococcus sp. RIT780]|uniref:hypothetical protein n=1 Tax=Deinococcus sp. RIT780 TaxID=2870472 RepID=UPI001C88EDC3|nr:hypothetical protein [Deinococcus sp. RIT780]MBX8463552.1 hypothetical protein [Deinococcus sp. RIT780]
MLINNDLAIPLQLNFRKLSEEKLNDDACAAAGFSTLNDGEKVAPAETRCIGVKDNLADVHVQVWSTSPAYVARITVSPTRVDPYRFMGKDGLQLYATTQPVRFPISNNNETAPTNNGTQSVVVSTAADVAAPPPPQSTTCATPIELSTTAGQRTTACLSPTGQLLGFVGIVGQTVTPGVYLGQFSNLRTDAEKMTAVPVQLVVRSGWYCAALMIIIGALLGTLPKILLNIQRRLATLHLALREAGLSGSARRKLNSGPFVLDVDTRGLQRAVGSTFSLIPLSDLEAEVRAIAAWKDLERIHLALIRSLRNSDTNYETFAPTNVSNPSLETPASVWKLLQHVEKGNAGNRKASINRASKAQTLVGVNDVEDITKALNAAAELAQTVCSINLEEEDRLIGNLGASKEDKEALFAYRSFVRILYKESIFTEGDTDTSATAIKAYHDELVASRNDFLKKLDVARVAAAAMPPGGRALKMSSRKLSQAKIGATWRPRSTTALRRALTQRVQFTAWGLVIITIALAVISGLEALYFTDTGWGRYPWDYWKAIGWGAGTAVIVSAMTSAFEGLTNSVWNSKFFSSEQSTPKAEA